MTYTVVITDTAFLPSAEVRVLEAIGANVVQAQSTAREHLVPLLVSADAVLVSRARIDADLLAGAPRLKIIARYGVGVDNVDVDAASAQGVWVTNVPDYCTDEVAEHTLTLALSLLRRVGTLSRAVGQGRWRSSDAMPMERFARSTTGLVGLGRIARGVATRARALGFQVLAFDPYVQDAGDILLVSLDDLLARSDVMCLHAPLTPSTHHLIGERELARMKSTAYLVNTSRGGLVDELALARALQSGGIAGAALDVLEVEPPPADHPLLALDGVILTPHVAFYSEEAVVERQRKAAEDVRRVLQGEAPLYAVNVPGGLI